MNPAFLVLGFAARSHAVRRFLVQRHLATPLKVYESMTLVKVCDSHSFERHMSFESPDFSLSTFFKRFALVLCRRQLFGILSLLRSLLRACLAGALGAGLGVEKSYRI